MNSKSSGRRSEGFFTGKGFYIVLFLCAAVICVSAWMMADGRKTMEADKAGKISLNERRIETVIIPAEDDPVQPVMSTDNPVRLAPPEETETVSSETEETVPVSSEIVVWPVTGELERGCSTEALVYDVTMRDWRTHAGVDITSPLGTPVCAAHCGIVESVRSDDLYGTVVTVCHPDGMRAVYANLAAEPNVAVGEWVEPGDTVGSVGDTALCEVGQGTHLHFQLMRDGETLDPLDFLP